MRIQSGDIIAGQPALTIRKLLQQEEGTIETITKQLSIDFAAAKEVFQQLRDEKYIKPTNQKDPNNKANESWENTARGNALAQASARKPITRHKAEQLVEQFLQRVKELNESDHYLYRIRQVIIFGSYLSDKTELGDIDLCIAFEPRYSDSNEQSNRSVEHINQALKKGRHFKNIIDMHTWPYQEVVRFLKGHSPSFSLHDMKEEKILLTGIPQKILFDADTEPESKTESIPAQHEP